MTGVSRVTLSLSPDVLTDIDYISTKLGISRSSFVNAYLKHSLPPAVLLVGQIPELSIDLSSDKEAKRLRGESVDAIKRQIASLFTGLQDDLFTKE